MRNRGIMRKISAIMLAGAVLMGGIPERNIIRTEAKETSELVQQLPTLTVDLEKKTGDILHGASGFLYGISNEDVPTTNTLVPLKPKVLATKGALGTEHPYGDALDVAETFLAGGGEQIMMYNSNYYGVFGVTANYKEYAEVLEHTIAPYVYNWKREWKEKHGTPDHAKDELGKKDIDKAIIYIPINEGTPVNGAANTNVAWKAYYDAIKKGDPDATLAGPNSCAYNLQFVGTDMQKHIQYCADNDCMPDIVTWHELETDKLRSMSDHMKDFRKIWAGLDWTKWLETHDGKMEIPQIVINEYAEMKDCGVPGALVNWIARLEDEKVYGCLPFWQQANNLNGLTSDANEGASAWWVYKWYGDMSGQTVEVKTSTAYNKLYGVASLDENKKMSTVLMGGVDGLQRLLVKNVRNTETFAGAGKVHVTVQKAEYNGYAGTVNDTQTILDGAYKVADDGSVEILIPDAVYADAYNVTITTAGDKEEVCEPVIRSYSRIYEAEKAKIQNLSVKNRSDYMPSYYFSGGKAVLMSKNKDTITYEIEIPVDGNYNLNFLYGNGTGSNRNNMDTHKPRNVKQQYTIDGEKMPPVIMENTLFTAITDCYCINRDFKAGSHEIVIQNQEAADLIQDALRVTYEGKEGTGADRIERIYEAELADFNTLADCKNTAVATQTAKTGFFGNGYVTGLEKRTVANGGGIRFSAMAERSGIYNITLRYQSEKSGKITVYVGNTTTELNSICTSVDVSDSNGQWSSETASIYLQKGINIIDVDADTDLLLDYMKISEVFDRELDQGTIQKIEAEQCISEGASIHTVNSEGASEGTYVAGMKGDAEASQNPDSYLEFEYNAAAEGVYALALFQSNDDICGSHTYNIKIIDKYATVQVRNDKGEITGEKRYFFINTSSDDTFREKTVYLNLTKGKNRIRIFNDDSWHVTWGGTQSTPGTNKLENYLPNFDCFLIAKEALTAPVSIQGNVPQESITFGTIDVEKYFEDQSSGDENKKDKALAYFVDCGDHDPTTLSDPDLLGTNNSVTDKIYGKDAITGFWWGVVTTDKDEESPRDDGGVYTMYQWANEWNVSDDLDKTVTFRYAHNQAESGIATRYVKYSFELEKGEYEVEVCMGNEWGNSANPDIHVDGKKINEGKLSIPQGGNKTVTGKLSVDQRKEIEIAAYSSDATINMNYIRIKYANDTTGDKDDGKPKDDGNTAVKDPDKTPSQNNKLPAEKNQTKTPAAGTIVKDPKSGAKYKITKSGAKNGTVTYQSPKKGAKGKIVIPDTVKIDGITYKVTAIAPKAMKGNKKVTGLTIGKNVRTIGRQAFYGCSKLKKIVIKTKKLSSGAIGKQAFKNISKKAVIKVPKSKVKKYKTILKTKGIGKKVKVN